MAGLAPHRPRQFIGVRSCDLRLIYTRSGRTRGFYARRRHRMQAWECQLSGFGMPVARWFSSTQTLALAELRRHSCIWDWKPTCHPRGSSLLDLWDGVPDLGYSVTDKPIYLFTGVAA